MQDLTLLRMSYWSGPNEAWIAVRRNSLALGVFPSLPGDLAEQALSEFVGLVRSGLYSACGKYPGWAWMGPSAINCSADLFRSKKLIAVGLQGT